MSSSQESRRLAFSFGMRFVMILMTVVCIGLVIKVRYDRSSRMYHAANAWIGDSHRQTVSSLRSPTPCPIKLDKDEQLKVLEYAVLRMGDRRKRIAALRLLVAFYPEKTHSVLLRAMPRQKDPAVLAAMLRVFGLLATTSEATGLEVYLDDRHAKVRAAAADAIACVFSGQFPWGDEYTNRFVRISQLNTVPPISVAPLLPIPGGKKVALPTYLRRRLESMLTDGTAKSEREAAGRALQLLPPSEYKLRVAEWGVWLSDNGRLELIDEVLSEIPDFVHTTGDRVLSFANKITQPMIIVTKPVVHITADRPLGVHLDVLITAGRPWFAYPLPSDFTLGTTLWEPLDRDGKKKRFAPSDLLAGYDRQEHGRMPRAGQDLPWRRNDLYGSISGGRTGLRTRAPLPSTQIVDIGLRWQNLLVVPERKPWMKLPRVASDKPAWRWWQALRDVPSSWVTSRGETERFLYYDGPTRARSPVEVTWIGDELRFVHRTMFELESDRNELWEPIPQTGPVIPRRALFIQVQNGQVTARSMTIEANTRQVKFADLPPLNGTQAEAQLEEMCVEYGLTQEESRGLIVAWKERFFSTSGNRVLMFLGGDEYDAICPLRMSPRPTELVRLGIVLTEVSPSP